AAWRGGSGWSALLQVKGQTMTQQTQWSRKGDFKFSAGPWNLHPGADPFGPPVRAERPFAEKLRIFKDLGFEYVQFHDDDAVPDEFSPADRQKKAKEVKKLLDDHGLRAEIRSEERRVGKECRVRKRRRSRRYRSRK